MTAMILIQRWKRTIIFQRRILLTISQLVHAYYLQNYTQYKLIFWLVFLKKTGGKSSISA